MNDFNAGYGDTLKTAGLEKRAINPLDVVQRVMGRMPTKGVRRHFKKQYLFDDALDDVVTNPKANPPVSKMLADQPMSTAFRRQYPKAPQMAEQIGQTEQALTRQLGEHAKTLPIETTSDVMGSKYMPPAALAAQEAIEKAQKSDIEGYGRALYRAAVPEGPGEITLSSLEPGILAHEGRHAQQFLPAEGSGYRPGIRLGRPGAVPRESVAGRPLRELDELLEIERDANLAVPGLVPNLSPQQMALQAAAQGTYESMLNPELRGMVLGEPTRALMDVLPEGGELIDRLRRGESMDKILMEAGELDPVRDILERAIGTAGWEQSLGMPAPLRQRAERMEQLREKFRYAKPEEYLSESGVEHLKGQYAREYEAMDPVTRLFKPKPEDFSPANPLGQYGMSERLTPLSEKDPITPFDKRFWRAAAQDPESVAFQAKRHQAVTDQLRTALGDEYADAYNDYVRQQVAQADPRSLFAEALTAPAEGEPSARPSSFVDRVRDLF